MFSEELKERIEEMKEVHPIYKEVIEDVLDDLEEETDKAFYNRLDEISSNGCASGIVPSMVHYKYTVSFYNRHKEIINEYISELCNNIGCTSLTDIFTNFDEDDILCLHTTNKNLLAWYGYEYVISDVLTMIEMV